MKHYISTKTKRLGQANRFLSYYLNTYIVESMTAHRFATGRKKGRLSQSDIKKLKVIEKDVRQYLDEVITILERNDNDPSYHVGD